MPSKPKIIQVKAHCHICDKFVVRTGMEDQVESEVLIEAAVAQLNDVYQCPHTEGEMEITTDLIVNKRPPRKRLNLHV